MVSDADISSGYFKDSDAEPARRQAESTAEILDDATAQKIMNTIRASRNFIDDAELAKQCRAVIEFYFGRQNYKGVIDACSLIDLSSLAPEDGYILITSLVMAGNYEGARETISNLEWQNKDDYKLTALGRLLMSQGKKQDAKAHFEAALRSNPENKDALDELNSNWPEDETVLKLKAEAFRLEGHASEAVGTFNILIERGEGSKDVMKSAGIAMADSGDYSAAEEMLKKVTVEGGDAEAGLALGIVQLERNEIPEGIESIEAALRRGAERNVEVFKRLALAYISQRENSKAKDAVEYLVNECELDEGARKAIYLSLLDRSKKTGNSEIMLVAAEGLLQLESGNNEAIQSKLEALAGLGRCEEGIEFLNDHNLTSGNEERMVMLLRRTGRLDEASTSADALLSKDWTNQEALFTKLFSAQKRGEGKAALKSLESAVIGHGGERVLRLYLEIAKKCADDRLVVKTAQTLISAGISSLDILGDRATAVERMGRLSQSIKFLKKAHRKHNNITSLEMLTSCYARHGRSYDEETVLMEAHASMHLPIALLERLAKLKMDRGEEADALQVMVTAMERKETAEGRYLQAQVLLKSGKAEEARGTALRAMQLGYPGKLAEYLAGSAEESLGNGESALERYNKAISYGLSTPEVFLSKAKLLNSMGRTEEAREEIESLEGMFIDNTTVQTECVEFYHATGMYQRCIEAAERAIRSDRGNERAWAKRGLSLLALKRYDDAITSLEAALKIRKDRETVQGLKDAYNAKGDRKSIIRTIDMLLEFRGSEKGLLLEKGDMLAESGKQDEAMHAYQTAMDSYGADEDAVIRKAAILHSQKKFQEELEVLLDQLKKDEGKPALLSRIAHAYFELKRYTDALEYADRAMQVEPDNASHLDLRAEILFSVDRSEEAERSVDIALTLSPKDPVALEIKGKILASDGRYAQALELLNGALAAGICNPQIYRSRGDCLLSMDRHSEALDSYSKALKDAPQDMAALLGRGICELNLDKNSSATLSLNELTKKDPENGKGWYYFGIALKSQKIVSEARKAFSEAVKLDDSLDRAWYELGVMQLESGELDEAENSFLKAVEYAPHSKEAHEELEICRSALGRRKGEENAISLLKLEYEMSRNPTKEEAFSICRIPMDEIDVAFDLINEPTALPVPSSGEKGWKEVEERSAAVLAKCFRNRETASYGVRLCDIVANFQSFTLDEAKQIFEYIARVQKLSVIDAVEDDRFEKLMKKATKLRHADRSLIGIISNLGVGIYTAKLIEGSLAAMGRSGYTTDFVSFSDSGKEEDAAGKDQRYDPYTARKELYEQFYGIEHQEEEAEGNDDYRCLYHGEDAIGECSSCQTNICNSCISVTGGHCPNCGVVLLSDDAGSNEAY